MIRDKILITFCLAILLIGLASAFNTGNIRAYWSLNESSSTAFADSKGLNSGTFNVTPTWTTGKIGNSVKTPATKVQGNTTLFPGNGAFSVSFWFNATSCTYEGIMGNIPSTSTNSGFWLLCNSANKLDLLVGGGSSWTINEAVTNVTITGGWKFIVVTFDGTQTWKAYVNGAESALSDPTGTLGNRSTQLALMSTGYTTSSGSYPGNIMLDEVGFYNKTLNTTEISELYNGGTGYYPFVVTSTCTCAGLNTNWAIALSDYCVISSDCNLGTGNITWTGTGNITFNATINAKNIAGLPANQLGYIGSSGRIIQG
jgi:hypothetical protein